MRRRQRRLAVRDRLPRVLSRPEVHNRLRSKKALGSQVSPCNVRTLEAALLNQTCGRHDAGSLKKSVLYVILSRQGKKDVNKSTGQSYKRFS